MGFSFEFQALGIVNDAVQDGVCQGGVGNAQVPVGHRDLAGEESGTMSEAIVKDFEQILGIWDGDGIAHPVVEDQEAGSGQGTQEISERAVLVGKGECM